MTFDQALDKLKATGELTSAMLAPLGISFETFLRFAQGDTEWQEMSIIRLIHKLENKRNRS